MPFEHIQQATRAHRRTHGCHAYTYSDGAALTVLAADVGARRVLELGTALGYTACCLAAAGPSVFVDTIEKDPIHVALARENIAQTGLSERVAVHEGDFYEVLRGLTAGYDLAFFDGIAPEPRLIAGLSSLLVPGGTFVVFGDREGHELLQRHAIVGINVVQRGRNGCEAQPLLDHVDGDEESRGDLLLGHALGQHVVEGISPVSS